jgi:hypothetical protein
MKSLFEAFHVLSTGCRGFTLRLPNSVIDPEFSRQFQRATIAFDTFARQIAVVYGSVDPSNEIRLSFKMSPLYLTGEAFMHEWIAFIDIFNTVTDAGIAPHLSMIDDLLSVYSNGVNTCVRTVNSIKYRTNAASKRQFESHRGKLCGERSCFDCSDFEIGIVRTARLINSLFDLYMPKTLSNVSTRTDMVYAVSGLAALLKAVGEFDARIENIKCGILAVNGELAAVHEKFRLPFNVELWIDRAAPVKRKRPKEPASAKGKDGEVRRHCLDCETSFNFRSDW